jgi:hypothetical protein
MLADLLKAAALGQGESQRMVRLIVIGLMLLILPSVALAEKVNEVRFVS